jgi:hypothetical protein
MQTPVQNLQPGAEITCPRCGAKGKVGIDRFKAAGKEYLYWTVRHYEERRVRRCVLGPYQGSGTNAKIPGKGTNAKVTEAKTEVKTGTEVPEVDATALDRATWYITKVLLAYGAYRAQPSEESFRQLLNVLKQLRERLNVDVSAAEAALAKLHARQSTDNVIAATTSVKELVKSVIARVLTPGTQAQVQAPVQVPLLETGDLVQSLRDAVREEVSKVVENLKVPQTQEVRVEVPKEVVESIQMVRDQIQAMQRDLEYVKEQVRQRKGAGARAVARGEKRVEFREGNMYWMIREVMKQGGEWTKEALADEVRRRFGKEVSGNSVSGRLSELAAAGYVAFRRQGRTWYWRWTGT